MRDNFIFTYMIDSIKVSVYKHEIQEESSFINKEFFCGVKDAIAKYLYYPYEVIAPRVTNIPIKFVYDQTEIEDVVLLVPEYITECTSEAFLNQMEENTEFAKFLIPEYATKPYITENTVDDWVELILSNVEKYVLKTDISKSNSDGFNWIKFAYEYGEFYGRYREKKGSKYLLVSLPGYNSDWNDMSAYLEGDYDILQLSPLGYNTPYGFNNEKRVNGAWPVLYDTVSKTVSNAGYNKWFFEVVAAVEVMRKSEQKLLFVGTSQGGGAALILSSIFNDCTVACSSEMPFMIGFSEMNYKKVRDFVGSQIGYTGEMVYDFWAKERLYRIDPLNHIDRINCGTYLLAGGHDDECPKEDIFELYKMLKCQKKFVELEDRGHGYTDEFKSDAYYWFMQMMKENEEEIDDE